jgi:hypothetical protein
MRWLYFLANSMNEENKATVTRSITIESRNKTASPDPELQSQCIILNLHEILQQICWKSPEISLIRLIKIFATVLMLWRADLIHWGFLDAF